MRKTATRIEGILLMVVSAAFVGSGQLLFKLGSTGDILLLLSGFACNAAGALAMIFAYKFGPLSVLQPMISLSYVLALVLGVLVLREPVDETKITGVFLICAGVVCISRSRY